MQSLEDIREKIAMQESQFSQWKGKQQAYLAKMDVLRQNYADWERQSFAVHKRRKNLQEDLEDLKRYQQEMKERQMKHQWGRYPFEDTALFGWHKRW